MIVAAGLSPAWQQILEFDALALGQVNRARRATWCASGKVLNVGIGLESLGVDSMTIAPLGGAPREAIVRELAQRGAKARWIDCAASTRVCTTILDRGAGTTTELVENAGPLTDEELRRFAEEFSAQAARAAMVVLTGSLTAGAPTTFYRDLLRGETCPAVLDVRGPELLAALECRPLLVKPNRDELARTLDRDTNDDASLVAAMRDLNSRGAQWVVVTAGGRPVWMTSSRATYRLTPPVVNNAVNPIGSGDALTAAAAWALSEGREPVDAVRLGMAAAIDNLRQLLPCRLDAERVRTGAEHVDVEETIRRVKP